MYNILLIRASLSEDTDFTQCMTICDPLIEDPTSSHFFQLLFMTSSLSRGKTIACLNFSHAYLISSHKIILIDSRDNKIALSITGTCLANR